jgi:hypothetical protein
VTKVIERTFSSGQSSLLFDKMGSIQQASHFKKIQNFKADYADATFTQYESQRTGLRVVVVDRKGPKVYGNFAVATEIHDDSGSRKSRHLLASAIADSA